MKLSVQNSPHRKPGWTGTEEVNRDTVLELEVASVLQSLLSVYITVRIFTFVGQSLNCLFILYWLDKKSVVGIPSVALAWFDRCSLVKKREKYALQELSSTGASISNGKKY